MRLILTPPRPLPGAPPSEFPLERARTLVMHESARLRPVSLARMPEADARAGGRVWLALECLQVTGSFKVRGALLALSLLADRARHVVAASAGNHGAGVAYAANILDIEATVVVPSSAPETKRERIRAYGAKLVVSKRAGYDACEVEARALADELSVPFVSPYDDPAVVAGNGASLGYEIAAALGHEPDVVIAPFGGGGLATGLAMALPDTQVFGAQSEASPAFAMSLERGEAVETLPPAPTLADGLEGGISKSAFERARSVVSGVLVVTEDDIARAMVAAHRQLGLTIEGSAAAALASVLGPLPDAMHPAAGGDVVVVLTGRNVDRARLDGLLNA